MYYLIVIQVFAGFFSAFVASRKGRNRFFWWTVGTFVPLLGVALALAVPRKAAPPSFGPARQTAAAGRSSRKRPKRCCGSYIPDCFGCPHFRRQLFGPDPAEEKKGYCTLFGKDLVAPHRESSAKVVIEDR